MQTLYLRRDNSTRLIAVFLGWAMDHRPFAGLYRPGYDLVLVWDYSDPVLDCAQWLEYEEIVVVGWSMGVYFSTLLPEEVERKVTRRIAVNGTLTPMHDSTGIPEAIFMGTLRGLNERNLEKFYFRVCGSREVYNAFMANRPGRDLEQLRAELASMASLPEARAKFDLALVSDSDAIFPPENQRRAWHTVHIETLPGAHLPDLQLILDRYVVDKDMVRKRFADGAATYESAALVQEELARKLFEVLDFSAVRDVLEVGCGTGLLSRRLATKPIKLTLWDICDVTPFPGAIVRLTDAEVAIKEVEAESLHLIVSASAIQWFNSPAGFLVYAARALRPGGILAIGTYARGNLSEITSLMPSALPLMTLNEWEAIVPDDLEVRYKEQWSRALRYDSPIEAFRHLKLTGVNSLGRTANGAPSLRSIMSAYEPAADSKWTLTYTPLILILRKK